MSAYKIDIKNSAKSDLKKVKRSPLRKKFDEIVVTLANNPYEPTDSFEKLLPYEDKMYSRHLNIQHRVVYNIDDDTKTVTIYSAWSHYE